MTMRPNCRLTIACAICVAILIGCGVSTAWASDGDPLQLGSWRNAIWAIGLFVGLLWILGRYFWKPVQRAIQAREQALADIVTETERRKTESEELLEQYRERLNAAEQDVARMLERSQQEAEATRDEIIKLARKQAAVAITEAERQIHSAKREALNEIYKNTADLATRVAGKIVRKEISAADHQRLVDEGLKRLKDDS